jgi:hypothetical protein
MRAVLRLWRLAVAGHRRLEHLAHRRSASSLVRRLFHDIAAKKW